MTVTVRDRTFDRAHARPRRDSVRVRVRDRERDCLTIHHKFRSNLVELRQEACRDGGLVADVTRHGAWARVALLRMARRAGTAATQHGGCLLGSRARLLVNGLLVNGLLVNGLLVNGLLMTGLLPAANEGIRWRFA